MGGAPANLVKQEIQDPVPFRQAAFMLTSRESPIWTVSLTCVAVCADQALQRHGGRIHLPGMLSKAN